MASEQEREQFTISHETWEWAKSVIAANRPNKLELEETETSIDGLVLAALQVRQPKPKRTP